MVREQSGAESDFYAQAMVSLSGTICDAEHRHAGISSSGDQ